LLNAKYWTLQEVMQMEDKLKALADEARQAIQQAADEEQLEQVRVKHLGRRGELRQIMQGLAELPPSSGR